MSVHVQDMTAGKPTGLIVRFALPLMLGSIFQQLYTVVDTIVVGKLIGVEALASLGAADWPYMLVLGLVIGLTQGFSIKISQCYGAEDYEGLKTAVTNSIVISAIVAAAVTALSLAFLKPLLHLLNTPQNVFGGAVRYLTVLFSGIAVVTAYNILSSILRALGDSKSPLIAMILASVINIVLDIVFVASFHWGITGAAAATVLGQLFSCFYCMKVVRGVPILFLEAHHWKPGRKMAGSLVKIGTPMALQNAIISVGGMVVQYVINGYGSVYIAGFLATNKLYGLLELAATSFGYSMSTFTGQNIGAGKIQRIRIGMNAALRICVAIACAISVVMILFGRRILMLFLSGTPDEVKAVLDVAYQYLFTMSCLLFVLYFLHLYRSALQGMGDTVIPMLSGLAELVMRISTVLILPSFIGERGLYYAEITAWTGAALILGTTYYIRMHGLLRRPKESGEITEEITGESTKEITGDGFEEVGDGFEEVGDSSEESIGDSSGESTKENPAEHDELIFSIEEGKLKMQENISKREEHYENI